MNYRILVYAVLALFVISCKVMYIPNSVNAPLLQEKNEFRSTLSITNYQFAYSPVKHVGIMLNGAIRNSDFSGDFYNDMDAEGFMSSRKLIEAGIGYYKPLPEGFIFEVYGGGGVGNIMYSLGYYDAASDDIISGHYKYRTNFDKLFLQPSIGYSNSYLDIAFSARLSQINFREINIGSFTPKMLIDNKIANLDKNPYYFFEPALTFRGGYKWIKLQVQGLYSYKLTPETLNYDQFIISAGIFVNFAKRHKSAPTGLEGVF